MGGCIALIAFLAIAGTGVWLLLVALRWLFCRAVVVAGDAKLISECTKCKYSLAGLGTTPTCPECNTHHSTIYTTHSRTEWKVRHELFWHWVVAGALCLVVWAFFSFVFPLVITAMVYWSKGWPAGQRIEQLMDSARYPWLPAELAFSLCLAWLAVCALSLRCCLRTICIAFAVGTGIAMLISVVTAILGKNWTGDWFAYYWELNTNPAALTFNIMSIVTLVLCMLIDATAHANRAPTSLPDAAAPAIGTSNSLTSDSAASPHTQSPRPPSPDPACSPPSTQ